MGLASDAFEANGGEALDDAACGVASATTVGVADVVE